MGLLQAKGFFQKGSLGKREIVHHWEGHLSLSSVLLCCLPPLHLHWAIVSQNQLSRVVGLHSGSSGPLDRTKEMGRGRFKTPIAQNQKEPEVIHPNPCRICYSVQHPQGCLSQIDLTRCQRPRYLLRHPFPLWQLFKSGSSFYEN